MHVNFIRDRLEIECAPSTWCNLSCSFCENKGQNFKHDPSVLAKTKEIIKTKGPSYKEIYVGFWGGELLADAVDESIILQYDSFLNDIYDICRNNGTYLSVDVCSNLIHHNVDWLLRWKRSHDIIISTSYDLVERFTKPHQLALFKENIEKIFDAGFSVNINMVAIKPAVDMLLSETPNPLVDYMNWLYNHNTNFEIEYYNNVCGIPEMVVPPKQLTDFMIWLYKKYPKFANFKHTLPINDNRQPEQLSDDFIAVYPTGSNIYRYPLNAFDSKQLAVKLIKQKHCINCQ